MRCKISVSALFVSSLAVALPEPRLPRPNGCPAIHDMSRFEEIIEHGRNDFLSASRATFSHIVSQASWASQPGADRLIQRMFEPEVELVFGIKRPVENPQTGQITYDGEIPASRIIQSTVNGPAGGGIRMSEQAVIRDSKALALEQQLKNLLMGVKGIAANGAKGVIAVNPNSLTVREFHSVMRQYVRRLAAEGLLKPEVDKPAPDVGFRTFKVDGREFNMMDLMFNELVAYTAKQGKFADPRIDAGMRKFSEKQRDVSDKDLGTLPWADEYMRVANSLAGDKSLAEAAVFTGKSIKYGGLQGRTPATGYGGFVFCQRALESMYNTNLQGKTIAVQGFGNVGRYFSLHAHRAGAKITKIADVTKVGNELNGLILEAKDGINVDALMAHVESGESLVSYQQQGLNKAVMSLDAANTNFVSSKVEILAPAALQKVIREDNVNLVNAELVLELANGPLDPSAQASLARRNIPTLADFLVNSGGVFASFLERQQNLDGRVMSEMEVNEQIDAFMTKNFDATFEKMHKSGVATFRSAGGLRAVDMWHSQLKAAQR